MTAPLRLVDGTETAKCGDSGGRTKVGLPCRRPAGWGLEAEARLCREHIHTAAMPEGVRPPPKHLSPESAELWRQITADYHFAAEGYPLLQDALEARDRARAARLEIERTGLLFVNEETGTPHPNPLLRTERDSWTAFRLAWRALDLAVSPPEE